MQDQSNHSGRDAICPSCSRRYYTAATRPEDLAKLACPHCGRELLALRSRTVIETGRRR